MGDIAGTIVMLCSQYQNIRFVYKHITDNDEFIFDTEEIKEALDGMPMQDVSIMKYLYKRDKKKEEIRMHEEITVKMKQDELDARRRKCNQERFLSDYEEYRKKIGKK